MGSWIGARVTALPQWRGRCRPSTIQPLTPQTLVSSSQAMEELDGLYYVTKLGIEVHG